MKIELTIETSYLPTWGSFEGLRELIQNGKDAETEHNAPLEVRHKSDTNTLVIENSGATLPHEALLFGHTTKVGREELIGKFGEGLKLGVLALVRAGHEVKIRSGSEVWLPKIERSDKFNADVLVIYIEKGRQPKERVQIEVSNVTKEEWGMMKPCFLFLNKVNKDRIETTYGALLVSEADIGKIFVKGIFVEHDPKLKFGYDLTKDVQVDRDRKMVARWDLDWRMRSIWQESIPQRQELMAPFFEAIEANSGDVSGITDSGAQYLPDEVKNAAVAAFKAKYGADALPVENLADSKDLEHLGKRGVMVNKPLKAILQTILGTVEKMKSELANEVVTFYSWSDLSQEERTNLESSMALVSQAAPITLNEVDVVDFRSPNILGMHKAGRVLMSKAKLADRDTTLETMVHEVAHHVGGDGDHRHVAEIERIWSKIVSILRSGK